MARRAIWRAQPDDPRTGFGWLLADADSRPFSPGVALGFVLALGGLAWLWSLWVLLFLPLIVLCTRVPARPRDLTPLRTTPPPGPAFDCRVESLTDVDVLVRSTLLGSDEGIVTFVDGWLHYAGRRTEFALRRDDLRQSSEETGRLLLKLAADEWLTIKPLDDRDDDFLRRAFRIWARTMPMPSGESLLPPTAVHPAGLARAWHYALLVFAILLAAIGGFCAVNSSGIVPIFFAGRGLFLPFSRLAALRRRARKEAVALIEHSSRDSALVEPPASANETRPTTGR